MRSAEFDREKVLRSAIDAFVNKGFNKTNMQDLKAATGLHPGSIYCAFENKQGLLLAALEQYKKDSNAKFHSHFAQYENVLHGLRAYLLKTIQDCIEDGSQKMCLSQKALSELAKQAPEVEHVLCENMQNWENNFVVIFEQAETEKQLSGTRSPKLRAKSLVMGIFGLRTYALSHSNHDTLETLAEQLFHDVCQ
jgi:AcrR family transcriptional regulator